MSDEIKNIQDAVQQEGRMEGGACVVPDDFFKRLNASLNPPQSGPSILDRIRAAADANAASVSAHVKSTREGE